MHIELHDGPLDGRLVPMKFLTYAVTFGMHPTHRYSWDRVGPDIRHFWHVASYG